MNNLSHIDKVSKEDTIPGTVQPAKLMNVDSSKMFEHMQEHPEKDQSAPSNFIKILDDKASEGKGPVVSSQIEVRKRSSVLTKQKNGKIVNHQRP